MVIYMVFSINNKCYMASILSGNIVSIIILLTIKLELNNAIFMMQVLIIRYIALYHNFT